jgi:hypothetical protein
MKLCSNHVLKQSFCRSEPVDWSILSQISGLRLFELRGPKSLGLLLLNRVHGFRNSSGSLAMLAAMRLASSLVSNFAADRRSGSFRIMDVGKLLSLRVTHDTGSEPISVMTITDP